jgi:hypothetical protein
MPPHRWGGFGGLEEAAASVFSIKMKIEVTCSSEVLENTYQTIWQDIPEDYNLLHVMNA